LVFQEETSLDGKKMDVRENKAGEDQPMHKWKEAYIKK